jgi:hydroxymethylbilane synthase
MDSVRIATRGSRLALWQANWVRDRLSEAGARAELVIIETQGDRENAPFAEMEGQGFFTKAVQDAVLDGRADLAVHSLKDLPSAPFPGLTVAAIPGREDVRDVLVVHPSHFDADARGLPLPHGTIVGTSAARRQAQLRTLRSDLVVRELRGNVPTRVEKLRSGEYGAVLLASAGLRRLALDLSDLYPVPLDPDLLVPAPGQGALALECRTDDQETRSLLARLDDADTRATVLAERGLMARLEGGCQLALGATASRTGEGWRLLAWYAGRSFEVTAPTPEAAAEAAFARLSEAGVLA